VRLVTGMKS